MKTPIIALFLFLMSSLLSSGLMAMDVCSFQSWRYQDFAIQTGQFNSGSCFVSVRSNKVTDLIYRSYLITSDGQLMVFNSFGTGPNSTDTGSRVFYFYPQIKALDLRIENDFVVVTSVSGHELIFDPAQLELSEITDAQVRVDSEIRRDNQGGVEIEFERSFLLDMGFKLGNTPAWDLSRTSTFKNAHGQTCSFKNRQLFYKKGGEVYPRYTTDSKIRSVIANKCPNFIF